jgi:hypothetical protein
MPQALMPSKMDLSPAKTYTGHAQQYVQGREWKWEHPINLKKVSLMERK